MLPIIIEGNTPRSNSRQTGTITWNWFWAPQCLSETLPYFVVDLRFPTINRVINYKINWKWQSCVYVYKGIPFLFTKNLISSDTNTLWYLRKTIDFSIQAIEYKFNSQFVHCHLIISIYLKIHITLKCFSKSWFVHNLITIWSYFRLK